MPPKVRLVKVQKGAFSYYPLNKILTRGHCFQLVFSQTPFYDLPYMAFSRLLIAFIMIILGAQIELPTNEFAKNDTITRDFIDYSYQTPPLSSVSTGHKLGSPSQNEPDEQELLPQIIGFKAPLTTPAYYLKIYDQFKPRDFYLII
jgi:hypothetical protein